MDVVERRAGAIAEDAGAAAVMALERVPGRHPHATAAWRGCFGPGDDQSEIQDAVVDPGHGQGAHWPLRRSTDPRGARGRLHRRERSADPGRRGSSTSDKREFKTPFVCGCRDLGEALRRIHEGAAMIRTKGEAGTGNIVEAVRHMRAVTSGDPSRCASLRRAGSSRAKAVRDLPRAGGTRGHWVAEPSACQCRTSPPAVVATPGRRCIDDAARRRVGVRRQWHLQVR